MPRQRRGGDRIRRMREAFQPLFLCAAKKKPLAVKRKRQRGICVGTNFTSLTLPQAAGLVRSVVPPFPARTASLGSRGSPAFAIPLKTTKKRADAPFLDHSRGLVCAIAHLKLIKRDADAYRVDRRGSRNTLRLFRLPYVKYSTGANITICAVYRAVRKPDFTVARRAFLDLKCEV